MNLKGLGIDHDKLETLDATETSEWVRFLMGCSS